MPVQIYLNDKIVSKSQDLRGLTRYAQHHKVSRVQLTRETDGGAYLVDFTNGAVCRGTFADFEVMVDWFGNRHRHGRSWVQPEIILHG